MSLLLVGHSHIPIALQLSPASESCGESWSAITLGEGRWLLNPGSVGQPRDNDPAAAYALFDTESERITFRRIPYDHLAAARKIEQAGLPASIAYRVAKGI